MKRLIPIICTLLVACATDTAPPGKTAVVTPQETGRIKTTLVTDSAARLSQSVDNAASRADATTAALAKAAAATNTAISSTTNNPTTKALLADVSAALASARSSNGELIAELSTLKQERTSLNSSIESLNDDIAAKEAEVVGLRLATKQANQDLNHNAETIQQLNKSNASLIKESASASVYKRWVLGGVSFLAIASVACLILKYYKPI